MYPLSLPTKARPPATVGCELDVSPLGKPKAHFNFRLGICAAVRPAPRAGWNRVLELSTPQPMEPASRFVIVGLFAHWLGMVLAAPGPELPTGRPLMNSATRRICISLRPSAWVFIFPVESASTIFSGVISRMASAVGP